MNHLDIRQGFSRFFEKELHTLIPPHRLLNDTDTDLFFINAGMNPLKKYLLGNEYPPRTRMANIQRCLRISGKHNDLEDVGRDTYHHTFFEMMGNWSFGGGYGRKKSILLAWELLTKVYDLPKSRLYATYFEGWGNENISYPKDTESRDIWEKVMDKGHVIEGGFADNFWMMGGGRKTPCGVSTEIHIDLRSEKERAKQPAQSLINTGHPQVIELWNIVFVEYEMHGNGDVVYRLDESAYSIDTGMGLERLVAAIQGSGSAYDTELFIPLLDYLREKTARIKDGREKDIAMRVVADHLKACAFAIADDIIPSNVKAGYAIRHVLRRATYYAYEYLELTEPFLYDMLNTMYPIYEKAYPNMWKKNTIQKVRYVLKAEETSFLHTLQKGLTRFKKALSHAKQYGRMDASYAFQFSATYGFPLPLVQKIAEEEGVYIDQKGLTDEIEKHRVKSKIR